jgi:hypothetical protein
VADISRVERYRKFGGNLLRHHLKIAIKGIAPSRPHSTVFAHAYVFFVQTKLKISNSSTSRKPTTLSLSERSA